MNYSVYWLIVELAANLFESIILFMVFETFFERKFQNRIIYFLLPVIHMGLITTVNTLNMNMLPASLTLVFLSGIYGFILYKSIWRNTVLLIILYHTIWFLTELCVVMLIGLVFTLSMDDIFQQNLYRLTGIVLSKTIQFIILKIIQHHRFKSKYNIVTKTWIALMTFPLATIFTTFSWYYLGRQHKSTVTEMFFTISSLFMLFANLVIFNLFESNYREMADRHAKDLVDLHITNEVDRVHQLQDSQNQIRQLAHDMRNKLLPLNVLISEDKKEDALEYLRNLHGAITQDRSLIDSGNPYIDVLVGQKIKQAEIFEIAINCKVDDCSSIRISNEDLCIIIGNALDNAIEACQIINNREHRKIDLELIKYRSTFMIKVQNPIDDKPTIQNGLIRTKKHDEAAHGFGLKSIKQIIDRNKGHLSLEADEHHFEFCAMLPV